MGERKAHQSEWEPASKLSIPSVSKTSGIFERTFSYQVLPELGKVDTIIF